MTTHAAVLLTIVAAFGAAPAYAGEPAIHAAIAAPSRPTEDTARDAERKPAILLKFSGIKPGETVADIMPGKGYTTRLFANLVGPKGHVYAFVPAELLAKMPKAADAVNAIAAAPGYANVSVVTAPTAKLAVASPVDVAWTSQNYHDLYGFFGADNAAAFDRAVFAMLRPGGHFIVIDHTALAGAPPSGETGTTTTLHRIDEATVKAQVLAAGFALEATSDDLRNPADPRTGKVFDPAIRGHTDQFMLRFRKPG